MNVVAKSTFKIYEIPSAIIYFFIISLYKFNCCGTNSLKWFYAGQRKRECGISYYTETYVRAYEAPANSGIQVNRRVKSKIVSAFINFGVSEKVDLQINIPYAKASGEATKRFGITLTLKMKRGGYRIFWCM